ncbi:MAG: glycosyltransferase family 4 protein [Muribaculaceae bacterium]|nr:glycosyltransferase family 4 protein [Muribaculaceae bacterium]
MKIVVTGTRGIPDIQGGVETHCEQLYPRIAAMGHDVTVIRRDSYVVPENRRSEFKGVKLVDVYAPRRKSIEAAVHTFLAVIKARRLNPDVLHIHAIGPSLMVPFARLLGMRVVSTNHGPDYDRQKWGKVARTALRLGERLGAKYSNKVIVISNVIAGILRDNYGRVDTELIFNGVENPEKSSSRNYLREWGIDGKPYVVALGRFVKEKGFHDLIEAYRRSGLSERYSLVIAGDSDHPDEYSEALKRQAAEAGAVLTGFIRGERLNQLMSNASLFVLPSYHEGLPIALLEAMSYGIDVIVSDIPANRIPELDKTDFFPAGDVDALSTLLKKKTVADVATRTYDLSNYDWDAIAARTVDVYRQVCES